MDENLKKLGFEVSHFGINSKSENDALDIASLLSKMFGFEFSVGNSSVFVDQRRIEVMKKPGRGANGHIAIGTDNIEEAEKHLKAAGYEFDEESRVNKNGKTTAIYLKDEIAGFAVHLLQKKR